MQLTLIQPVIPLFDPGSSAASINLIEKGTYAFFVGVAWTLSLLFLSYITLNPKDIFYRWINIAATGMACFWTLAFCTIVLPVWRETPAYLSLILVGEKLLLIGLVGGVHSYLRQQKNHQIFVMIGLSIIGTLISLTSIWTHHQLSLSVGKAFSSVVLLYSIINTVITGYKRAYPGAYLLACALFVALIMSTLIAFQLVQQPEFTVYIKIPLWLTIINRLIIIILLVYMLALYNANTRQLLYQKQNELEILLTEKRLLLEQQYEQLEQEVANQTSELRVSNAIKDRMFSVISHDLRSPIASLKDTLILIQQQHLSPADFQTLLQRLTQHVERVYNNLT